MFARLDLQISHTPPKLTLRFGRFVMKGFLICFVNKNYEIFKLPQQHKISKDKRFRKKYILKCLF